MDGFGRISLNWPNLAAFKLTKLNISKPTQIHSLSNESKKIANTMAGRLLNRRLENALLEFVLAREMTGQITSHSLARLRKVLRREVQICDNDSVKRIEKFFGDLKSTARDQLMRVRIKRSADPHSFGERFLEWFLERLRKLDAIEAFLNISPAEIPRIAGEEAQITNELKLKFTLRLLEAVVNEKMRQNRREA